MMGGMGSGTPMPVLFLDRGCHAHVLVGMSAFAIILRKFYYREFFRRRIPKIIPTPITPIIPGSGTALTYANCISGFSARCTSLR